MGAPDIVFHYRPSPSALVALVAIGALAIVAVWTSGVPAAWRIALGVGVVVLAGVSAGRLLRPRIAAVAWRGDGTVDLTLNDTPRAQAVVEHAGTLSGRALGSLLVLTLRCPPHTRTSLWLLPDNLDADTRRRLRMRLGAPGAGRVSVNADSG